MIQMCHNISKYTVELGDRSYPIYLGWDILEHFFQYLDLNLKTNKILLISNEQIFQLYGAKLLKSLEQLEITIQLLPDGEKSKSLSQAAELYQRCCQLKLDRNSTIVALGGGVIGDIAGFVAATYMRGINFVQVPTTLLAQVDSSVGGKVGINLEQGKNLVGAFYQPKLVYMDLKTLTTLPMRELKTGIAEIIKHGVLDADLFKYLENHLPELMNLQADVVEYAVKASLQIKSHIVSNDEREDNYRAVLNFGHTIGHAIETITQYGDYRHGEAVAIGMKYAGAISAKLGKWQQTDHQRMENMLKAVLLPTELPSQVSIDQLLEVMQLDKKNKDGKLTMILPTAIGKVEIVNGIDENLVKQVLSE